MPPVIIVQLLILLMLANGTPLIAKNCSASDILIRSTAMSHLPTGGRCSAPRRRYAASCWLGWQPQQPRRLSGFVGRPVFWSGFAMAGDLFSSFCKRRLGMPTSSRASGLDQIPEALLPLLACRELLALTAADIAVCVVMFAAGEVVLLHLLYAFRLRDHPY